MARRYNLDLNNEAKYLEAVDEFLAEKASQGVPDGNFWQKICAAFRQYLRNRGFKIAYSDNDIQQLFRQSLRSLQRNRQIQTGNNNGARFSVDGKYFKNWQDVLTQFKKDLEGVELNQEQQDIYDVVTQQKDKIRLRINDLNELEDIFINFGTRKKGVKKLISVHYAGLRNPVTALEVLNIGDVIRRGKLTEEGTKEYPTSRRYELKAEDGATLKVIIDFNEPNDKNRSVINFYSDRPSDTGAHNVSSGIITDLTRNLSQNPEKSSENSEKIRKSISPQENIITAEEDAAYLDAVNGGDMEAAELMVRNAEKRSEYFSDSDYQGSLAFNGPAPSKNGYYDTKDAWDRIIEDSYYIEYFNVDNRHAKKRQDLKGQFVYSSLINIGGETYVADIKLDDTNNDKRAHFKDISIKKWSLYTGRLDTPNVDLSADHNINVSQFIEKVKSFK